MRCIAHRGCAARAPENTVRAVELAAPHVDMVEVDVRRCGSGELVVFHDERLGRLTDGRGRVADRSYDHLRRLYVEGSDERIPLLPDLLAAVPPDVGVNVECKHAGVAADLLAALNGVPNEVLVSSFDPDALREVGEASDLPLAYLFHREVRRFGRDWTRAIERARRLGCSYLHPEYRLCLERPERIDRAHDGGFEVNTWTVKHPRTVERLREAGVDGVIVDDWAIV
ncbi:glycerophosphodiester phosphodiesterase [Halomarina litorea]|uniref:glycerophosphodiester phosphodiesterase n=1 Tax=Halomarina litorea TaxID=2961595 RepID=UPI0020C306AC|nr:glycerophosphodiester phosphodiesterase family protein [Halomarina sp. BCD28]